MRQCGPPGNGVGGLGIGLGAAFGRRGLVLAVTAAVGVLAYALHAFAGPLGLSAAATLSPFHHYLAGEPRHPYLTSLRAPRRARRAVR